MIYLSISNVSVYQYITGSIYQSIARSIFESITESIYQSITGSIDLSINLISLCRYIYESIDGSRWVYDD